MARPKVDKDDTRMFHVRVSEEDHRRLRVRVAELDTSIQDWVAELVIRELDKKIRRR